MNSTNFSEDNNNNNNNEPTKIDGQKIGNCVNGGTKEILCDGYFYDVTNFIDRHPGGSIIKYYTKSGEDATHAIQQFHHRSIKRVRMLMKSFKRRPASEYERTYKYALPLSLPNIK